MSKDNDEYDGYDNESSSDFAPDMDAHDPRFEHIKDRLKQAAEQGRHRADMDGKSKKGYASRGNDEYEIDSGDWDDDWWRS